MSQTTFGCHLSGNEKPATCAGFLLLHGDNNLLVRLSQMSGRLDLSRITDGGFPLYDGYVEMAVANGVDPDDPALAEVRKNGEFKEPRR